MQVLTSSFEMSQTSHAHTNFNLGAYVHLILHLYTTKSQTEHQRVVRDSAQHYECTE